MSNQPKSASKKTAMPSTHGSLAKEGLELEFNSLHAQRESVEAFSASQQHVGWECLPGGIGWLPSSRQLLNFFAFP
jgi:site-specific DNA recombinase